MKSIKACVSPPRGCEYSVDTGLLVVFVADMTLEPGASELLDDLEDCGLDPVLSEVLDCGLMPPLLAEPGLEASLEPTGEATFPIEPTGVPAADPRGVGVLDFVCERAEATLVGRLAARDEDGLPEGGREA